MSYLVSASFYRPTKFDNVVGQKHVTTTLKKPSKIIKLAMNIYLWANWSRKTTCARIFARTLMKIQTLNTIFLN